MLPFGVKYKQFKSVMDILLTIPFLKSDTGLEGHEIEIESTNKHVFMSIRCM